MTFITERKISKAVENILCDSYNKKRNFVESIEIFFSLKNYDSKKQKKISGLVTLSSISRHDTRICLFTDVTHSSEAKALGTYYIDFEGLKKLKDKKKTLKKITKKFHKFLVSEKLLKTVLRILGPGLTRCGKFPSVIDHSTPLEEQINRLKKEVRIYFKKTTNSGLVVGNVAQNNTEIQNNIILVLNFFYALIKKKFNIVKTILIKRSMGTSNSLN
ncbi:60S ribosomal protein L10A (nucleomorph) [Lotharella oceanica]|uniref:60S ribosomal protein L10A n=1 Tax=Lotharella oceanica TaxID=641309 RepID=A0A060DAY0_9EUKA|nr:60S ribosomal protein L10A [Lotharella oceanica]|mmetsp:Transcript_4156/g.7999  ORF Transcript_4156/g.7999 Transcript_4156/m.7999 type:complete len:217 (+) Transcript_4156:2450-3100(+)